jgi:transmembrane sensor
MRNSADASVSEEAAHWLVRLESDDGADCRTEFVAWLRHSPLHLEEFLLTQAAYSRLNGIDAEHRMDLQQLLAAGSAEIVSLHERADVAATPARAVLKPRLLLPRRVVTWAAVIATCVVLAGWLTWFMAGREHVFETLVGEQRSVQLEDGSVVYLNTDSAVAVRFTPEHRELRLLRGEALFSVAHDRSRPFRVAAGSAVVQAVGTQFNVYRKANETTVAVIEGRVQLFAQQQRQAPVVLGPGQQAHIGAGHIVTRLGADSMDAVAWRQRQLDVHGATLADIVEQVNRYNSVQLRVPDAAAGARQLTGLFAVDDIESLLQFLNRDGDLSFDYDLPNRTITIRSKRCAQPDSACAPSSAIEPPARTN